MSNFFMSEEHFEALTRAAPEIRHRFRFSQLLSELEARGEITSSNIQGIKACKTDNDKGDELLDILKKGSADTFDVFCACLESKNVNQPSIVKCIKQYLDDIVPPAISASDNRHEKGSALILRGKKDGLAIRCFPPDLHSDTRMLIIFNNKFDGAKCRQCETEAGPSVTCEKCFTCVCVKCENQVLDFDGSHVFRQYIPIRICRRHRRESCDLTTWCASCEDVCCYRCVQATEHKDHITSPLSINGTGSSTTCETISTKLEMRLAEVAASFTYPAAYYGVERTLRAAKQRQQKYVTQFTPDVFHSLQQTIDQLELLIKPCKSALDARNDFIQLLTYILESHDPVMLAAACSQLPAYNPLLYQDILTESHVTLPYMTGNPLLREVQYTTHSILPTFSNVALVAELYQDYSLHGLALNLQEGVIYTRSDEENKAIQIYDSEADSGDWKPEHLTASECFTGEELQGLAFDCKRDCLVIPVYTYGDKQLDFIMFMLKKAKHKIKHTLHADKAVEKKRKVLMTALIQNDYRKVVEVYDENHVYLTPEDSVDLYIEILRNYRNAISLFDGMRVLIKGNTEDLCNKRRAIIIKKLKDAFTSLTTEILQIDLLDSEETDWQLERDLLLQSIFFNRTELALFFIKQDDSPIASALVASALLRGLGNLALREDEYRHADAYQKSADDYEMLAVKAIDGCYDEDNTKTIYLVTRRLAGWKGATLFSIADSLQALEFMSTTACQSRLSQIWKGTYKIQMDFDSLSTDEDDGPDETMDDSKEQLHKTHKKRAHKLIERVSPLLTPESKMKIHFTFYLLYLGLMTYFVNNSVIPIERDLSKIRWVAALVWGWTLTMCLEEIRQMTLNPPQYPYKGLDVMHNYLSSGWNWLDMLMYATMTAAVVLHVTLPRDWFYLSRDCYVLVLYMSYMRIMQIFYASQHLGPLIVMIREMMTDLVKFLAVWAVFFLGYAVSIHSLRYPNHAVTKSSVAAVLYEPYWNMFGEFFEHEGSVIGASPLPNCTTEWQLHQQDPAAHPRCPEYSTLAVVIMGCYVMITNVLLLNLLIAIFNNTYQMLNAKSSKIWRFYRHQLVFEYYEKPFLPPPLIIVCLVYRAIRKLVRCGRDTQDGPFYRDMTLQACDESTGCEQGACFGLLQSARGSHHTGEADKIEEKEGHKPAAEEKAEADVEKTEEESSVDAGAKDDKDTTSYIELHTLHDTLSGFERHVVKDLIQAA